MKDPRGDSKRGYTSYARCSRASNSRAVYKGALDSEKYCTQKRSVCDGGTEVLSRSESWGAFRVGSDSRLLISMSSIVPQKGVHDRQSMAPKRDSPALIHNKYEIPIVRQTAPSSATAPHQEQLVVAPETLQYVPSGPDPIFGGSAPLEFPVYRSQDLPSSWQQLVMTHVSP